MPARSLLSLLSDCLELASLASSFQHPASELQRSPYYSAPSRGIASVPIPSPCCCCCCCTHVAPARAPRNTLAHCPLVARCRRQPRPSCPLLVAPHARPPRRPRRRSPGARQVHVRSSARQFCLADVLTVVPQVHARIPEPAATPPPSRLEHPTRQGTRPGGGGTEAPAATFGANGARKPSMPAPSTATAKTTAPPSTASTST